MTRSRSTPGKGTLGGLMQDPAAYNALKASLENLQTMTAADQQRAGRARPVPERRSAWASRSPGR